MKAILDCIPCFLQQALDAVRMASDDTRVHERVMHRVLAVVQEMTFQESPPQMGALIHRIIREQVGHPDPYHRAKQYYNSFARKLLPRLRRLRDDSTEPFAMAVRLAVAANIIDFALSARLDEDLVLQSLEQATSQPLAIDRLAALQEAVQRASSILYLADNAGEIVLDLLLVEMLPRGVVTVAVRGAPVINDATTEDALFAGLDKIANIIDNGTDIPGTVIGECSQQLRQLFASADLVISKGQGNYETLSDEQREIYHLLKVKCPLVARDLGCPVGGVVVMRRQGGMVT
ncbi:MAG: hypothetical protein DRI34_08315 [Deltaproteobacteria bacterium]|nr:MAG: hypothetical protein DRI34_08315 [Deltaproteobacteria bacterium]